MLSKLVDFGDYLTLAPNSGIQFVEYGFNIDNAPRLTRSFIERPIPGTEDEEGRVEVELIWNWDENDPSADPPHAVRPGDQDYDINAERAMQPFLEKWVPVPFLRIDPGRDELGNEQYAHGPQDWARMRIVATGEKYNDKAATHRVIFAFDTTVVDPIVGRAYLAPTIKDGERGESFRFVHRRGEVEGFLRDVRPYPQSEETYDAQAWVRGWLQECFIAFVRAKRGRVLREGDIEYALEHVARYIVLLELIDRALPLAKIAFVDNLSDDPAVKPIDVDLVLDVGNSRSCGILIQSYPDDENVNLNNSMVLQLRDMQRPELVYTDPFSSSLELAQVEIGPEHLARRSQRGKAFVWPSMVRLGEEAARYRRQSKGNEAMTGMSSPKRYLWDGDATRQDWSFRTDDANHANEMGSSILRAIRRHVNGSGDVLAQVEEDNKKFKIKGLSVTDLESAKHTRFSRSSFFTYMMMEIIAQAMMMINNPAIRQERRFKDAPQRLRRIILTIPSATPVLEQRIIRSRTEAAIKLLWLLLDKPLQSTSMMDRRPTVSCSWDEASSVHVVYLYQEITQQLGGNIRALLDNMGRPRKLIESESDKERRSLRIASVDIGAGTTDLMVTTYFEDENRAIVPQQEFREGFRRAGDDFLKEIVQAVVLPSLRRHMDDLSIANAGNILSELFDGDRPNMSELEKHRRRHFVSGILAPVAIGVLQLCEDGSIAAGSPAVARKLGWFFDDHEPEHLAKSGVASYFYDALMQAGLEPFNLEDVVVSVRNEDIDQCVKIAFGPVFANISEALHHYDADIVLLTGRPSKTPQIISFFYNQLAVPLDRIVPIKDYRVGNWYPFRDGNRSVIADPKTTAVVGAMLCALSEQHLMNFTLYTDRFQMRSTARYIGEIETSGVLRDEKILFSEVSQENTAMESMTKIAKTFPPARIGYRQLPFERWVATPLYRLVFVSSGGGSEFAKPFKTEFTRADVDKDDKDAKIDALIANQAALEAVFIASAEDARGKNVKNAIALKLDTLSSDGGTGSFWLDTGIVKTQ